jgi:hypothetical protein
MVEVIRQIDQESIIKTPKSCTKGRGNMDQNCSTKTLPVKHIVQSYQGSRMVEEEKTSLSSGLKKQRRQVSSKLEYTYL